MIPLELEVALALRAVAPLEARLLRIAAFDRRHRPRRRGAGRGDGPALGLPNRDPRQADRRERRGRRVSAVRRRRRARRATEALERRLSAVPRVKGTARVIYQSGLAASAATPDGVDAVIKGIDAAGRGSRLRARPLRSRRRARSLAGRAGGAAGRRHRRGARAPARCCGRSVDHALVPRTRRAKARGSCRAAGRFRVAGSSGPISSSTTPSGSSATREALRALVHMDGDANVVEVKLDGIHDAEGAARAIDAAAGRGFSVSDSRSMNGGLFAALTIQQTTLFLVIGLIVAVSTFNIVATLVMTVQEKKRDIGVLAVLGAEPGFFSRLFLWLGLLLGGTGVAAGVVFGSLDLPGAPRPPACSPSRRASPRSTSSLSCPSRCGRPTSPRSSSSPPWRSCSPPGSRLAAPPGWTWLKRFATSD